MKRKLLIASTLIISIVLISVVVIIGKSKKETVTKEVLENPEESVEVKSEKIKDDATLQKETKELLNTLLEDSNYKELSIIDEKLTYKYNSLKGPFIYYYSIDTIEKVSDTLIAGAVFYNIKDEDIIVDKKEDKYTYGYINKEKLNYPIKELFGNNDIQFSQKSGWNYLNSGYLSNTTKENYYHADFIEEKSGQYYFKFFGITGDGTWSYPQPQSEPIKMISARDYKDYILVISKAIYAKPDSSEAENGTRKMNICADTVCNKKIGELSVSSQERYFPLNIDDYLENAGIIYTIFRKSNDNYYYYKNIIDN